MKTKQIAIVSQANDLHAHAVKSAMDNRYNAQCYVIETDRGCGSPGVDWSNVSGYAPTLLTTENKALDLRALDLLWWRRNSYVLVPPDITDMAQIDLMVNDTREALLGLLITGFRGIWVSDPQASRLAENKLVQLQAAKNAGFRVPQTLISQIPTQIRLFCANLNNKVVCKTVKGTRRSHLLTIMVSEQMLESSESLSLCPAIYQEYIPGKHHVRAHCFGDSVYSALIESETLDWRPNLDVPVTTFKLDEDVNTRLKKVVKALGLEMGIIDLKLANDGEPVWLECNPQGQFLFIEGLSGLNLTDAFTDFLYLRAQDG